MADEVLYEVEERIAFITLNRPQARNAVNGAVATAMNDIMHRFESDPEVWVAILTGAGNRAFSAGADLKAMASGEGRLIETQEGGFGGFVRFPRTKPVIAAVNGLALAGGTELVLACDMVIAIEEAEFGLPEVSRGIIAAGGGLFRLPLALPRARAIELILTGERIGAREAYQLGLVNYVVPAAELMPTAKRLAARICANAPLAVRESLDIARSAHELSEAEAWARSAGARTRVMQTADAQEGPRAFAEKREPTWTGR
ncbi:MAG: enoyl-CoA hydratase [Ktedonobacter sp. 13_2_20CM_53_11]|jgi:enoyl-CoA hydratase|nr:MAG: enoyl-CoA hydratase [Ktedonobacter sp. 13_2_20CM_53_11]